jgi:hypothetical protein
MDKRTMVGGISRRCSVQHSAPLIKSQSCSPGVGDRPRTRVAGLGVDWLSNVRFVWKDNPDSELLYVS